MPVDQFATLVSVLPEIEQTLRESGETLPRPVYLAGEVASDRGKQGQADSERRGQSKHNIEATSDEESET